MGGEQSPPQGRNYNASKSNSNNNGITLANHLSCKTSREDKIRVNNWGGQPPHKGEKYATNR